MRLGRRGAVLMVGPSLSVSQETGAQVSEYCMMTGKGRGMEEEERSAISVMTAHTTLLTDLRSIWLLSIGPTRFN